MAQGDRASEYKLDSNTLNYYHHFMLNYIKKRARLYLLSGE